MARSRTRMARSRGDVSSRRKQSVGTSSRLRQAYVAASSAHPLHTVISHTVREKADEQELVPTDLGFLLELLFLSVSAQFERLASSGYLSGWYYEETFSRGW
jgi:hypothetical protein